MTDMNRNFLLLMLHKINYHAVFLFCVPFPVPALDHPTCPFWHPSSPFSLFLEQAHVLQEVLQQLCHWPSAHTDKQMQNSKDWTTMLSVTCTV